MLRHAITIKTSDLPVSHKDIANGRYPGKTLEDGDFTLVVNVSQRGMSGTELMRATIAARSRGRPGISGAAKVEKVELQLLIGNQSRKDIKVGQNGYYSYGPMGSRSFRDCIEQVLNHYCPKSPASPGPEAHI